MAGVGEIIWGSSLPLGGSTGTPAPSGGYTALSCVERHTRKMLAALSSVFDTEYRESPQSHLFAAVADSMCRWAQEAAAMKAAAVIETSEGTDLEVCGANYGARRPNIGLTDERYRELIRIIVFDPKCTVDIVRRAVEVLTGLTPTITEPLPYTVRIEIPSTESLDEGFGLGFYPSANPTDTDATGRGRGYAGSDLSVSDYTGHSYVFGPRLGAEALEILDKLVAAGIRVEVVST